ncbi:hypothetical protein [Novosphingobium resinovorum]|uniref:hypothetical protein n=1 Tax=Novosphingobium resinovorum TaxID=158500 RepID=UPI003D2E97C8
MVINGWRTLSPHTRRCFEARLALLRHAGNEPFLRAQPLFLYPPDWIAANDALLEAELAHHIAGFPGAETMEKRIAAVAAYAPAAERLARLGETLVIATRDDFLVPCAASLDLAGPIPGPTSPRSDGAAMPATSPILRVSTASSSSFWRASPCKSASSCPSTTTAG